MPKKNDTLTAAKDKKSDEFYTQYEDIQREINAYLEYDPDTFRNKTVLLSQAAASLGFMGSEAVF